jgi:SAM-dependent methyltransferase
LFYRLRDKQSPIAGSEDEMLASDGLPSGRMPSIPRTMNMSTKQFIEQFNADADEKGGYGYTTHQTISSQLATRRTMEIIIETKRFSGRSVVDIGCGDGFFTRYFWDNGCPRSMVGVDRAESAISLAKAKNEHRQVVFQVGDAHALPFPNGRFEVGLIQSILHHDEDPRDILREGFRVARELIIHEPNGYNIGLKIIEKTSAYHRAHGEKSYTLGQITRWVNETGGRVVSVKFAGFVPMFCPDGIAKLMKWIEPVLERVPIVNRLGCAVVAIVAVRGTS